MLKVVFLRVQAAQDEVAEAAAVALCEVFTYYIEHYYDSIVPAPPLQCKSWILLHTNKSIIKLSAGVEPEQIFHSWMHNSYLRLIQELLHLMKAHCSQDIQVSGISCRIS